MVTEGKAACRQRVRWEGGRLRMLSQMGGRLLVRALRRRDPALVEAWIDLVCPPLGSYAGILAAAIAAGCLLGSATLLNAALVSVVLTSTHVAIAMWHRQVSGEVWRALLLVPQFLLGKVPVYLHLALPWSRQCLRCGLNETARERIPISAVCEIGSGESRGLGFALGLAKLGLGVDCRSGGNLQAIARCVRRPGRTGLTESDHGDYGHSHQAGGWRANSFRQVRVGKDGRKIQVYKFRSMVTNAEKVRSGLAAGNHHGAGVTFKMRRDPRVTKVGRWIRNFSIDEMPQFFNVLEGDMSLVGPRPALPKEVACYDAFQLKRLTVKPGISCLWQIEGRADIDFEGQVRLDLKYIHSSSIWSDIVILLKTVPAVVLARGAY